MKKLIHDPVSLSEDIVAISKSLKLHSFINYKEYIKNDLSTEEVLYQLLKAEQYIKDENKYKYRIKNAGFPIIKTLDTFEFDSKRLPDLNKDVVMELATCKFVENRQNIVAVENSGTGKTHLMTAICIEAITNGYTVKFRRASDIVTQMTEAASEKYLSKFIKNVNSCDILFIDELGFLSFDAAGASLLFQIFAARYETKSTVVTSNLEFSKWVTFLGKDEQMTSALIGRLVHQSTVLNMNGENYRVQKR
ncbi:IS21-like element helper ATPase IstB [Desulfolucanica intricata]|uniref:IS21-like element helper ATPase IstB n=1 Tax=Desulfolucanica intricata TaxID=1285191 RepID=UPI00082DC6CF|nr:IS21-like element helper ATPase IstB [Desulfolucanica intricata]